MINFFHYRNLILFLQNPRSGLPEKAQSAMAGKSLVEIALPTSRQAKCGRIENTYRNYD
jgi:hypothetical protein